MKDRAEVLEAHPLAPEPACKDCLLPPVEGRPDGHRSERPAFVVPRVRAEVAAGLAAWHGGREAA